MAYKCTPRASQGTSITAGIKALIEKVSARPPQGFQTSDEMREGPVGALLSARAKLTALEAAIAAASPPPAEGEQGGGGGGSSSSSAARSQAGLLRSLEMAAAAVSNGGVPRHLLRMLEGELAVERAEAVIQQIRAQARPAPRRARLP